MREYGIDFEWGEKEKDKAHEAWNKYNQLSEDQQDKIGEEMIALIESKLLGLIEQILDDSLTREVEKIVLELVSNLGEVKVYEFDSVEEAIKKTAVLDFTSTDSGFYWLPFGKLWNFSFTASAICSTIRVNCVTGWARPVLTWNGSVNRTRLHERHAAQSN